MKENHNNAPQRGRRLPKPLIINKERCQSPAQLYFTDNSLHLLTMYHVASEEDISL